MSERTPKQALDRQIDGDHYRRLPIQPITFSMANRLNAIQHCILKHMVRYPHKGEPVTDLRKIIHYAEIALQMEQERAQASQVASAALEKVRALYPEDEDPAGG